MSTVLVVAAHPDDEVLGAGGTIVKRTRAGDRVFCLALGDGVSSRYESPENAPRKEIERRRQNAKEAGEVLGIEQFYFCEFPDNRFDTIDLLDLIKEIENVADQIEPDLVYTHHRNDLNIDHRRTHEAVMTAFRPMPGSSVRDIYSFEVLSSTEWSGAEGPGKSFQPNVFVDVNDTWAAKMEAMRCYAGEIRAFPHPRSEEAMNALARRRGSQSGLQKAEAFSLLRSVVE